MRIRHRRRSLVLEGDFLVGFRAGEHFAQFGYMNTSHADIAAEAGIGRTTFYEYFASTGEVPTIVAVRTARHKLVTYPEDAGRSDELYDLVRDPGETENLIGRDHVYPTLPTAVAGYTARHRDLQGPD